MKYKVSFIFDINTDIHEGFVKEHFEQELEEIIDEDEEFIYGIEVEKL